MDLSRPFSLLVKPVSADCNLCCEYCFYLDHLQLYPDEAVHRMSDATLEQLVASYLATDQPTYSFIWQGGEPTLLGLEFFRRVTDLQQQHGRPGSIIANGLQTNATLITKALAHHLAEYRFLVGVSLDGPGQVHDAYRHTGAGAGTHAAVIRGIGCLRRAGVEFNVLTLVTAANVGRAREVYRYLCDQGLLFHQYIPCVEFDARGQLQPCAVTGEAWGQFLCELFDEWHPRDARRVSVRLFDSIIHKLVLGRPTDCMMDNDCCQCLVVEYNGDVFPCDFFVQRELKLGSIHADTWERLRQSPAYAAFGRKKLEWPDACAGCQYLDLCHGGCPRHRIGMQGATEVQNVLCAGWKRFFQHAAPHLERLAAEVRTELPPGARGTRGAVHSH
ncbi:MAG TPA: anaerobic sulfatase maturase [Phycisphaerae bacterium]|nr:anaerobic sulfatase maturase [Phycisphaerae bacterium]HNU44796.1 anaerobic sulfatase maturase [Phycisphaerae bacterium]